MRLGILGQAESPYVAELQRAAAACDKAIDVSVLRFSDLQVGLGSTEIASATSMVYPPPLSPRLHALPSTIGHAHSDFAAVDVLLVRSMPIGSLEQVIFRMDCLQTWQARNMRIINSPRCLEIAIDKWLCLQRLVEAGVEVPPTICCQTKSAAMQAFEMLGRDVLVKPLFGGEGRGILHVNDPDLAWRIFGTLHSLGQVLYVQQFVDSFGYDVRVLFIGDEHFAIRRRADSGGWRTNLSQGGSAEPHCVTDQELQTARKCRDAVEGAIVGVDLLPARDGRLFALEVNAVPGWRGLSAALQVDIGERIINFVTQ